MGVEIKLRGMKEGIVINTTCAGDFDSFISALDAFISANLSVLTGGKIAGLNGINLTDIQKTMVAELAVAKGIGIVSLDAYVEKSPRKTGTFKKEEFEIEFENIRKNSTSNEAFASQDSIGNTVVDNMMFSEEEMADTVFYRGTLRSGAKLVSDSHIVVVGDVNPGAELIAAGNIVVLGILRGFAHAGSAGDEKAIISAWKLDATQIRIADIITVPPEDSQDEINYPEVAMIEGNNMIIKSYL